MSWSLLATPLHAVAAGGAWDWAASATFAYGIPDERPPERDLPTVAQVLSAFRQADCHGTAWFHVAGLDPSTALPTCPGSTCDESGGLDLGEVSLQTDDDNDELQPETRVHTISFRKPSGRAVLAAVSTLAAQTGPLLLFDTSADQVFVVSAEDDSSRMTENWPW